MLESKIALTERLRREGRWDEASKFKDNAINGFRTDGMKRGDAAEAAWAAMADAFPPVSVGDTENTVKVQDPGPREVKAMLKQLEQDRYAEMHDNVPKVLQKRVNEMLAKWWQQYEVSLFSDARRQLESGICELIYEGLRACTASPAEK